MRVFRPAEQLRDRVVVRVLLLALAVAAGSCGDSGRPREQSARTSSAPLPAGFAIRLDRENRAPEDFVATESEGELTVRTGPAGILYRLDQSIGAGRYAVRARFTEIDAPAGHREGFGLFIGGQDLQGLHPRYTYFLVRGDGRYLIKERDGESTSEVSNGWQTSEVVRVATAVSGDVTNELAIVVDEGRLQFSCNGQEVATVPTASLSTHGMVGVRVNHNLQVRVQGFRVEPDP